MEYTALNITKIAGLAELLEKFSKRISVSYSSDSTRKSYLRTIRDISLYHGFLPNDPEIDEILDYLHHLREKELSWAKIKMDGKCRSHPPNHREKRNKGTMRVFQVIHPPRGSPRILTQHKPSYV